jgi:hypothetical protein
MDRCGRKAGREGWREWKAINCATAHNDGFIGIM